MIYGDRYKGKRWIIFLEEIELHYKNLFTKDGPVMKKKTSTMNISSKYCKQCVNITETQYHVLQCKNCERRQECKKKFLDEVRKVFANTNTNSDLSRVIVHHISAWINQEEPEPLRNLVDGAIKQLEAAVEAQHKIGWGQIFKGRITIQWAALYNHGIKTNHKNIAHKNTAERWGRKFLIVSMQFALDMWGIRNDIEHDTEGDPVKEKKRKLIEKILWGIKKIGKAINHPYEKSTFVELINLPLQNLQIIDTYVNPKRWKWHIQEYNKRIKITEEKNTETEEETDDEDISNDDGTDMDEEYSA
jgi:hypothetical protein